MKVIAYKTYLDDDMLPKQIVVTVKSNQVGLSKYHVTVHVKESNGATRVGNIGKIDDMVNVNGVSINGKNVNNLVDMMHVAKNFADRIISDQYYTDFLKRNNQS